MLDNSVPYGYCHCGCGGLTTVFRGEPRRYISGHNRPRGLRKNLVSDDGGRQCSKCGKYKSWEEFSRTKRGPNGRFSSCKDCVHDVDRLRNFGVTPEDYRLLLKIADGKCDLCRLIPEHVVVYPGRNLAVDHFHGCDQGHDPKKACISCIRGLLCIACNQMIGYVEKTESEELQARFSDYLARRPLIV